jgi:hypothetical protein
VAISAADALASYAVERLGNREAVFRRERSANISRLGPGVRRKIGWIRCESLPQLRVRLGTTGTP